MMKGLFSIEAGEKQLLFLHLECKTNFNVLQYYFNEITPFSKDFTPFSNDISQNIFFGFKKKITFIHSSVADFCYLIL